ncbi:uncharacterized protein LOC121756289 isoform X2 [Salvia splendens]|uniref:uncharacterized protein LOC121756289 isoform X2 n=1 Tax=Salvia splendens TaxID=180675 RepID=UPI001C27894D|nr:uncharacterized protein LOC121756289 isoform X2 [Salvia splendens]XP_042007728.1 uncharacterized protein LOC121756289 isoform X2 [Salvia splendens]
MICNFLRNSQRDDDVKQDDGDGSNVGELRSPTSEDHEKPTGEAEAGGASSMEGSIVDNGEAEKEIRIEDESGVKHGIVAQNESNRKPYDGGSSSSASCGSSSDDESCGIKKGQAESSIAYGESSLAMDDSLSGKVVEPVYDSQAAISVAPGVFESTLEGNEGKNHGTVEESTCTSMEEAGVGSAESTPKTSDPKECKCVTQENDNRSTSPRVDLNDGEKRVKESLVTQPFQKTSWKSCCGLFEVFSGSGN